MPMQESAAHDIHHEVAMFRAARLPFLAATAFAAATAASTASADWQYTHWGMSKTQALLASNGALMPPGSRRERAPYVGLVGHYAAGDRNFDAALLFDDGDDLVRVVLTQRTSRECAGTLAALQDKYGQAQNLATLRGATLLAWNEGADGNRVKFDSTPRPNARSANGEDVACTLTYAAPSPGDDGL